jgi:hypothetical protein
MNSAKKAPQTTSSESPKPATPARGRRPYATPQLIAWGTLLDLTQGHGGISFDGASGVSKAI